MDLARLESEARALAEAIEPGGGARLILGYVDNGTFLIRRLSQSEGKWIDLGKELAGDLLLGVVVVQENIWPDCPEKISRTIKMLASWAAKLPFLKPSKK